MDQPRAVGSAGDARNPYVVPQAPPAVPPLPAAVPRAASRWARLGARLVDQVLMMLTFAPAIGAFAHVAGRGDAVSVVLLVLTPLSMLALFVTNLILLDRQGQTLGKRVFGIRILRRDGSHPTLGRSFGLRAVVPSLITLVASPFGLLDVLWILGDERRCLHDLMADTVVVRA